MRVRNPKTGALDYEVEELDAAGVARVAQTARRAGKDTGWAEWPLQDRLEELRRLREGIAQGREALVAALARDTGRVATSHVEVDGVLSSIDRWIRRSPEILESQPPRKATIPLFEVSQQRVPYELVGVVSPWNFPLLLALIDAIPALVAGCAVVVKPSELTPRFIEPFTEIVKSSCPSLSRGILTFITGGPKTGKGLTDHVDLLCFTGSIRTGRLVAAHVAERMIPVFLEMGGKDPAIVTESADMESATSAILWGSVVNSGQSCLSLERVYVDQSILADFVARLVSKAEHLNQARLLGPIISHDQVTVIKDHLEEATRLGAKIVCGGRFEESETHGSVIEATILTDVNHTMRIMKEETFGPIVPIQAFDTVQEAIDLANDTVYGLSGAVFSRDASEAQWIAEKLNVGAISINDAGLTAMVHDGEKSSFGLSGVGPMSRMGDRSVFRFLRTKALLTKVVPTPDPWWFDTILGQPAKKSPLQIFEQLMTGYFDNREQIEAEKTSDRGQVHPFNRHVNGAFTDHLTDLPDDFAGVVILEETYRWAPGSQLPQIQPLLLHFRETSDGSSVELQSLHWSKDAIPDHHMRNDNPLLKLSYADLSPSPTFPDWVPYTYDCGAEAFLLKHTHSTEQFSFTLEERIEKDKLTVMEDSTSGGKRLTTYDTPIEYRRFLGPA